LFDTNECLLSRFRGPEKHRKDANVLSKCQIWQGNSSVWCSYTSVMSASIALCWPGLPPRPLSRRNRCRGRIPLVRRSRLRASIFSLFIPKFNQCVRMPPVPHRAAAEKTVLPRRAAERVQQRHLAGRRSGTCIHSCLWGRWQYITISFYFPSSFNITLPILLTRILPYSSPHAVGECEP
jgi:hypothetical protein